MPRDALWVLPSGVTTVVTVDDDGNLMEPAPELALQAVEPAAREPGQPPPAASPPLQQPRKRGRHRRH